MTEVGNYLGEIRMSGSTWVPTGWAACDGRTLRIDDYPELFSIIGTDYGGDGESTFGLPDLRGRVPVAQTRQWPVGASGGESTVPLARDELPPHTHPMVGTPVLAGVGYPADTLVAQTRSGSLYLEDDPSTSMAASAVTAVGGSGAHQNLQPYLCISFIIALGGIYPSRGGGAKTPRHRRKPAARRTRASSKAAGARPKRGKSGV
jgi:microcystin-dependent protein